MTPCFRLTRKISSTRLRAVLHLGCRLRCTVAGLPDARKGRLIGVDAYDGSIQKAREHETHDEFHVCDVLRLGGIFPDESIDGVVALDLIEHLEKKDGLALLDAIERIARKRVVIFTPNGFLPQGEYDNNPWQVHKSGWEVSETVGPRLPQQSASMAGVRCAASGVT